MFKKILVALDLSQMQEPVFWKALSLAQTNHAQLRVIHVLSQGEEECPVQPDFAMLGYFQPMNDSAVEAYHRCLHNVERKGLELLKTCAHTAASLGIPTQFDQPKGETGPVICRQAREWTADLIVLGRRGRSGLSELFLGSISSYVLHHAPCSVLTVHRDAQLDPELQDLGMRGVSLPTQAVSAAKDRVE